MPTYVYRREDGTTFEIQQRITEDSLETCPTTGQAVKRVISGGTGLIFKGSGFYLTDYVRNNGKDTKKKAESDKSSEKGAASSEKSTSSSEKSTSSSEKGTSSSEKNGKDSTNTSSSKSAD